MASLWKRPRSKFWYACFTAADGRQLKRSTKTADRKKALKIAVEFETVAQNKKTKGQLWRVLKDLNELFDVEGASESSFHSFTESWIKSKRATSERSTLAAYKKSVSKFLSFLGHKGMEPMQNLEKRDISLFRDEMAESFSKSTVNHDVKIIKMIFRDALDDGVIPENPGSGVKSLRSQSRNVGRRAFTEEELGVILANAKGEWRGMVLFGLYTGQRLKDIAQLKWDYINMDKRMLVFQTSKTGRIQRIPIVGPLFDFLSGLSAEKPTSDMVFPKSNQAIISHSTGGTSTLSNQFYEIMTIAGLVPKRLKMSTGKGHSGKRKLNQISFHALRHTTTSLLKNAGVAASIVQDIVGHESSAISDHYTHVDDSAKYEALAKLPSL